MKGAIWGLFGFLAALWSLLAWLLHGLAGSGSAAVVTLSRWLDIEPASTQWLADGLAMAGGLAQVLVVLAWLVGMGMLGLFGWMGSRAVDGVEDMGLELQRSAQVRGAGPVIEGEFAVRPANSRPRDQDDPARLG
jgi:hypothetical protein